MDRDRRTLCQAGLALAWLTALPASGGRAGKADAGGGDSCDVTEPSGALVCKVSPTDALPATTRLEI